MDFRFSEFSVTSQVPLQCAEQALHLRLSSHRDSHESRSPEPALAISHQYLVLRQLADNIRPFHAKVSQYEIRRAWRHPRAQLPQSVLQIPSVSHDLPGALADERAIVQCSLGAGIRSITTRKGESGSFQNLSQFFMCKDAA